MKWRNLLPRLAQDFSIDARWRIGLAAVALLTRVLCRTRFAYSWDVADFILATRQFDLRLHLPHPLGYVMWVQMGRLALPLGLDAHTVFLNWNAIAAALGVVFGYDLARRMWDRQTAIVAGLLMLTSPAAWFYAGTGYADIWDATLGSALALLAWEGWGGLRQVDKRSAGDRAGPQPRPLSSTPSDFKDSSRRFGWRGGSIGRGAQSNLGVAALATLVYSLAAGIRQQNVFFLFPLWVMALWPLAWRVRLGMAALMAVLSAAWAIPLVNAAGGLAGYRLVVQQHTQSGLEGYSWTSWRDFLATGDAAVYVLAGIQLGVTAAFIALPFYLWHACRLPPRPRPRWWQDRRAWLLLAWALPSILFLLVVHLDVRPGLTLGMLPAVLLATAAAMTHVRVPKGGLLWENTTRKLAIVGIGINLVLFFVPMDRVGRLIGNNRVPQTPTSWPEMWTHDRRLASEYAAIRKRFDPRTTLLISDTSWYWYSARQAAVYLPDYENWYIGGPNSLRWWATWYERTWTLPDLHLPDRIRTLVFIHDHRRHPNGGPMEVDADLERHDPLPGDTYVCWMPVTPAWRDLIYTRAWHGPHPTGAPLLQRP